MDWKDRIAQLHVEWNGRKVIYQGEQHTVVDVDYNGALLIDRETMYNKTTAIEPYMLDKKEVTKC